MEKHVHGGDVYQYQGCIDFSSNCSPLGTPPAVIAAGIESLSRVSEYPQVGYLPLRKAIAEYENVPTSQVICGNGAAEVIFTLCRALQPKQALLPAPSFAEYGQALESVGCKITYHTLLEAEGFQIKERFLQELTSNQEVVFLCNPNNPTGVLTEKTFLQEILQICKEKDIFLVVDECFQDFIREPENYTLKEELKRYPNLFLLKAFTKRYAMAGIRLGYGLTSNQELIEKMERCVQPWNVSTIAQHCGIAALKETEYVKACRSMIFQEQDFLKRELKKLGLKVYDSWANYIFFRGPEDLFEQCLEKKILIRDCSNYEGLEKGYYRVAVKLHPDNCRLIEVLQEVLPRMQRGIGK